MSVRITWLREEERLAHELRQLREEGLDPASLAEAWAAAEGLEPGGRRREAQRLLDEAASLARSRGGPAAEEELVRATLAAVPWGGRTFPRKELERRIRAGWLGRAAGCLLGKPVEKVPREGIRAILESAGRWPLDNWFSAEGVPPDVLERYPWNRASRPTSLRENISCMPEDDDLNYSMLNLHVAETAGLDFTTDDVAAAWLSMLPALTVFTAERVAYQNLLDYLDAPETAWHRNPYREWIGAQIRADVWGWLSPGDPAAAAALAWRDARLSHTGNGAWGELYAAALVAAAFTHPTPGAVVRAALAVVPRDSRLAAAVRLVLDLHDSEPDFERAVDRLYAELGHYHWVHAINNAALLTAALLYGEGDYSRSITLAVAGGWDTDCNGATAGAVVGTMLGAVPERWTAPLRDTVRTSLKGFDNSSLSGLAARTARLVPERYRAGGEA
ncbi:MAG TPA: ADP-ribosylglycohydrolase family protein [Deinococcales bacterium]|nr:ADP-ribosylglycohydrolase family protein [Deinococcales bacterium]